MGERTEILWRIPVGIITLVILGVWEIIVKIVVIIHWLITLITGKRSKDLAEFTNNYINYLYRVWRYLSLATNERPFPFNEYQKPLEPVVMRRATVRVRKGARRKR